MHLAIIPARSGSKGISDKNIRKLCGKPLMAYSIVAALESKQFNDVIVSTDSNHYADIAKAYGASVPFLRSAMNSSDAADSWSTTKEVLDALLQLDKKYDTVTVLQPTSPLRTATHINEAFALYNCKNANAVISVCECEHSPLLCNTLDSTLCMDGFIKPDNLMRRQDMAKYYRVNGAIYILGTALFNDNVGPFNPYKTGAYGYIMPNEASVDIDNMLDMALAELILTTLKPC